MPLPSALEVVRNLWRPCRGVNTPVKTFLNQRLLVKKQSDTRSSESESLTLTTGCHHRRKAVVSSPHHSPGFCCALYRDHSDLHQSAYVATQAGAPASAGRAHRTGAALR